MADGEENEARRDTAVGCRVERNIPSPPA
jgi:hypothetical protein